MHARRPMFTMGYNGSPEVPGVGETGTIPTEASFPRQTEPTTQTVNRLSVHWLTAQEVDERSEIDRIRRELNSLS